MRRFELLLHHRVEAELRALRTRHRKFAGAVDTAVRKLFSDPHGAGKALIGVTKADRQGSLLRLRVGGREGHRLFYWLVPPSGSAQATLVIPVFLSSAPRSRFDYEDIDVNTVGMDIVEDFRSKRFHRFRRFRNPTALISFLGRESDGGQVRS